MTADPAGTRLPTNASPLTLTDAKDGPTALRIMLGSYLRQLRERTHITREQAAAAINATPSKIARLESGRSTLKHHDATRLLTLYGVSHEQQQALLDLVRHASTPGWWHLHADLLPDWFEPYIGLEAAAAAIRSYHVQFVHSLMQTEDYARALIHMAHPDAAADEIDRRVHIRMTRQQQLVRPDGPLLWIVLDEAALRRPVGTPQVMRDQLTHLLDITKFQNVVLQILPFDTGAHPALGGPFTILRFPEPNLPDLVYLQQLDSALYLNKRDQVDRYMNILDRLCLQAMPPTATRRLIGALIHQT